MCEVIELDYKDLEILTDNFSEENFIYHSLYCKVYRGKIPQGWRDSEEDREIAVKVWIEEARTVEGRDLRRSWGENLEHFNNEIEFLGHHKTMPNLAKLMGFCREEAMKKLGVVYDLKSWHVLEYLSDKEQFNWSERIKVAHGLARLIEHLHANEPPYMIRDLWTTNIMIDQDFNPVLFNSIAITGGILGDKVKESDAMLLAVHGSQRYLDANMCCTGTWDKGIDVYAFGIILLELILRRRVSPYETKLTSFLNLYHVGQLYLMRKSKLSLGPYRCSLADPSFIVNKGFHFRDARALSSMAFHCVHDSCKTRPTPKKVVETFERLQIAKKPIPDRKRTSLKFK